MLAAFAEAARVFKCDDYAQIAQRDADFTSNNLPDARGKLFRSWKDRDVRMGGFLEDYANPIGGLVALYQITFEGKYFVAARELAETMLDHFSDPRGAFFDTSHEAEQLVTRPIELQDNATPSSNAMRAG